MYRWANLVQSPYFRQKCAGNRVAVPVCSSPQVQGERELRILLPRRRGHGPGGGAEREEALAPPAFRLVGVHGEDRIAPPAGMGDVVRAAAHRPASPNVDDVEDQGRMHWYGDRKSTRLNSSHLGIS